MEKISGGTLTPAYGRNFTNRDTIVTDLNAGKDFILNTYNGSGYCSIRDIADCQMQVRDMSGRKLWVITIQNGIAR